MQNYAIHTIHRVLLNAPWIYAEFFTPIIYWTVCHAFCGFLSLLIQKPWVALTICPTHPHDNCPLPLSWSFAQTFTDKSSLPAPPPHTIQTDVTQAERQKKEEIARETQKKALQLVVLWGTALSSPDWAEIHLPGLGFQLLGQVHLEAK